MLPPLQGLLAVDYIGLQMVALAALQGALATTAELKAAQGTLELTVMGSIEQLKASVRSLQALLGGAAAPVAGGAAAGLTPAQGVDAGAARADDDAASSASSASLLQAAGSLAALLDSGDVEMSDVEDEGSGSYEPPGGDFAEARLTEEQLVDELMRRLGEQPAARKLYTVRGAAAGRRPGCMVDVCPGRGAPF